MTMRTNQTPPQDNNLGRPAQPEAIHAVTDASRELAKTFSEIRQDFARMHKNFDTIKFMLGVSFVSLVIALGRAIHAW